MLAKDVLKKHNACHEAIEWAGERSVEESWNECERGDWMLWIYKKLHPNNFRELTLAKAHCANTVRHLMKDKRSIDAIDIAIKFGNGEATKEQLNAASAAAYAAAYAAYAAADAYAYAAASAAASAADADVYAAASAASAADAADAYAADAKKENQKQTADICRKYLIIETGE